MTPLPRPTDTTCYSWADFIEDFLEFYAKRFDAPPTAHARSMAVRDWRAGNIGWEAAHNAQRRAKARLMPGEIQRRQEAKKAGRIARSVISRATGGVRALPESE